MIDKDKKYTDLIEEYGLTQENVKEMTVEENNSIQLNEEFKKTLSEVFSNDEVANSIWKSMLEEMGPKRRKKDIYFILFVLGIAILCTLVNTIYEITNGIFRDYTDYFVIFFICMIFGLIIAYGTFSSTWSSSVFEQKNIDYLNFILQKVCVFHETYACKQTGNTIYVIDSDSKILDQVTVSNANLNNNKVNQYIQYELFMQKIHGLQLKENRVYVPSK